VEKLFQKLDEQTDRTTRKMFQILIERKMKFDRCRNWHLFLLTITCLYFLALGYAWYKFAVFPKEVSAFAAVSAVLGTNHFVFLFLVGAVLFGSVKIFYERKEKAEKEFQDLRREIIEKSRDLWNEESWPDRDQIFEQMKAHYDINLFHESK
jgi:hypothetical protein